MFILQKLGQRERESCSSCSLLLLFKFKVQRLKLKFLGSPKIIFLKYLTNHCHGTEESCRMCDGGMEGHGKWVCEEGFWSVFKDAPASKKGKLCMFCFLWGRDS